MIPIYHRIHNKCLISILYKEDKIAGYYQKLQQSPSMHQFKKILHVLYLAELLKSQLYGNVDILLTFVNAFH